MNNTQLLNRLGYILDKHVAPIFKPGVKLTLTVRTPGDSEADVLVTSEADLQDVIALLERSKAREVVKP
jgi:hypothetical protein